MKIDSSYDIQNQLWSFDVASEEWNLLSGETVHNGVGVHGTLGVPDESNTPPATSATSCWTTEASAFYVGFGSTNNGTTNSLWKYESEASAIGDPHITSIWGCTFEAEKTSSEAVLMSCESAQLKIRYNARWNYHVYEVVVMRHGQEERFHWNYLKHGQKKEICGNAVEFHRYFAGINVRLVQLQNRDISGLFNDTRCLHTSPVHNVSQHP